NLTASECGLTLTDSRNTTDRPPPRDGPPGRTILGVWRAAYPAGGMSSRMAAGVVDVTHVSQRHKMSNLRSSMRSCMSAALLSTDWMFRLPNLSDPPDDPVAHW